MTDPFAPKRKPKPVKSQIQQNESVKQLQLPKIMKKRKSKVGNLTEINSPWEGEETKQVVYKSSTRMQDFITGTKMLRTIERNSPEKQYMGPLIATIGIRAKRSLDKFWQSNGASEKYELYSILEQEVKRTSNNVVKSLNLERRNYGSVYDICKQNFKTQDEIHFITEWLMRKITYL